MFEKVKQVVFVKNCLLSIYWFFTDFILNRIINYIPIWFVRKIYLCLIRMDVLKRSRIDMGCTIMDPFRITIGEYTHINRDCLIDGRGGLVIGSNVSVSQRVVIMTGSHEINDDFFAYKPRPVVIEDYVWIGVNATILQNVTIGKGAVVAAGAVVTKDVEPYSIVAGIPAQKIGERTRTLSYHPLDGLYFYPMFT